LDVGLKSKIQNPKSKIQNFLGYMSQSLTRKNFSDIVLDPTTITVVGSIAIHAIFAANLAFFTQPSKELKKPDPGTVKVVELTPSELQRIPQAPKPVATPTPSQQILPPVYQPSIPAPPVNQPITPPIVATAPETIPLSPTPVTPPPKKVAAKSPVIRNPPKQKVVTKPPAEKKDQKASPQAQPEPPTFDPDISFKTTPEPTPTPDKPPITPKPSPPPKKKPTSAKKPPKTPGEGDSGGEGNGANSKPSAPGKGSIPIDVPAPGTKTATTTKESPSPQPTPETPGDENQSGTYGKYAGKANERLQEYGKLYPGILERSGKPRALTIPYPVGTVCPKSKQKPFIVLMVVFGKVTAQDPALGSETTGEQTGRQFVAYDKDTPENKKLGEIAVARALEAANTADQNREQKNKDKEFLYQYRVTFDPTTCKKP
jgi:hypothetical protein